MASNSKRDFTTYWPIFFLLTALESAGFIIVLLRIPSEAGLSLSRLFMLGILTLGLGLSLLGALKPQTLIRFLTPRLISGLIPASALLTLIFALGLFLLRYSNPERLLVYYQR